jgi:hypothetical protein
LYDGKGAGSFEQLVTFGDGPQAGTMKLFVVGQMSGWQITINDVTQLDQLWLVARYTLG